MKKNKLIAATAAVFAFQLLISACLCGVQVYRMKKAESYKLKVSEIDLPGYDDYLHFYLNDIGLYYENFYDEGQYIPLTKDENGFAVFENITGEKPETDYLLFDEAFNYSIYATNNYKILDREAYNRINKKAPEGIGMAVRIYHGKIIHIDGIYNETEKIIEIR